MFDKLLGDDETFEEFVEYNVFPSEEKAKEAISTMKSKISQVLQQLKESL